MKKRIAEDWMMDGQRKLIEDESIVWQRKTFKNADGYWIRVDNGNMLGKVSDNPELPPNVMIEKNAWDHEHCSLCWQTISEKVDFQHEGYTNGKDWLCIECYNKYI